MAAIAFMAIINIRGVNPYVDVDKDQAARIMPGWRKPMPVLVKVNGQPSEPWRINMMPAGNGNFYLYLHGEVRKASDTKVGDMVRVEIDFDREYRSGPQHAMPAQFAGLLDADASARASWDALPPSRQKEILRYFDHLKSEDALQRNIRRMLEILSGNTDHFMGRDWRDGF